MEKIDKTNWMTYSLVTAGCFHASMNSFFAYCSFELRINAFEFCFGRNFFQGMIGCIVDSSELFSLSCLK
jgi:hypothetical protein